MDGIAIGFQNLTVYLLENRNSSFSFGKNPTIVGLSIGSSRKIDFVRVNDNNKKDKENQNKNKFSKLGLLKMQSVAFKFVK